jgi:hypothetical protein
MMMMMLILMLTSPSPLMACYDQVLQDRAKNFAFGFEVQVGTVLLQAHLNRLELPDALRPVSSRGLSPVFVGFLLPSYLRISIINENIQSRLVLLLAHLNRLELPDALRPVSSLAGSRLLIHYDCCSSISSYCPHCLKAIRVIDLNGLSQ